MEQIIKTIWIESEEKGSVLDGQELTDDNSDVIVTFADGRRYVATFFTYDNIKTLTRKNKITGEQLSGKYFWASDMILVQKVDRLTIEQVIVELIEQQDFDRIFELIE